MTTVGSDKSEFELWAPRAEKLVELLLPDQRHPMSADGSGWWRLSVEVPADTTYAFSLDGGEPRPDPRGRRLPDGPHGWSQRFDVSRFGWTDQDWRGVDLATAVVYEMHVGTFTHDGTFGAAVERLDHLVDLGVDLVEVMPVAPFPGRHGWGYDGVAPFAVHEPYGGPEALQRFVDAAHAAGVGVCLDVVYNHLGPDGNNLGELAPYFTDGHETPWGQALNLDGPDSDPVRRYVLDNVTQWLRDFHLDALRLDAVHELHDERALTLLEEMSRETDALSESLGRPLWLIAESDRNDARTVMPRDAGGFGVHAQWADDVHHGLHVALTGEAQGYYADFADPRALPKLLTGPFFHDGTWSSFRRRSHGRRIAPGSVEGWRFVASLQTHDQVGNRMAGDRLSMNLSPGLLACGAALLLTSPFTPMLFMGEEWGAGTPWQYFTDHTDEEIGRAVQRGRKAEFATHGWDRDDVPDPQDAATVERSRLNWSERDAEPHARLLRWYRDLVRLRRSVPDLSGGWVGEPSVEYDASARTVLVARGDHRVLVNLSDSAQEMKVPDGGTVLLAWDTDTRVNEAGTVTVARESALVTGPDPVGPAATLER